MKKLLLLLCLHTVSFAQTGFLKGDSLDIIIYKPYQDSVDAELGKYKEFVEGYKTKFGKYFDNKSQYASFVDGNIDNLEMDLFDLRDAQKKYLASADVSQFLKDYLNKEVEFQYWHLLYAFPIIKGNADTKLKRVFAAPDVLLKGFNKASLKENANLKYTSFRSLLLYWITYENSKAQNYEKYSNHLLAANDKIEMAKANLSGLVLDYGITQILYFHKLSLSRSLAQNAISQIENETLRNRFLGTFLDNVVVMDALKEKARLEEEAKASSKDKLDFIGLDGKGFDLSKYKGKVIYLDFWASWCGPCKVQFPHSKVLWESIPDKHKKNIVFLYISIDDTQEKWKDAVKSNNLEKYEHGFTEGAWGSPVLAKLGIRSIPRYMIIDKSGKIVDNNAKRPNNPETLSDLLKFLEQ